MATRLVSGMDRIWQWAWDRYGPRYSWAIYAGTVAVLMPVYLVLSFVVVAFESSGQYVESAFVTVVAVLVLAYVMILPGLGESRLYERWAAGQEVDRARALDATYAWTRGAVARGVGANAVVIALLFVVVGAIAGASGLRLVQYAIMGAASGIAVVVIAVHSFPEAALRPVRVAITGDTGIGDSCPDLTLLLPPGRTCPCLRVRSRSPSRAPCWRLSLIGPVRSPCSAS